MKITADRIVALANEAKAEGQLCEAAALEALAAAMIAGEDELEDLALCLLAYCERAEPRMLARLAAHVAKN
jgi:hypothetical protein